MSLVNLVLYHLVSGAGWFSCGMYFVCVAILDGVLDERDIPRYSTRMLNNQSVVKEYSGKDAGTADFQRVVEKDAPGNWSYFFNAWIYDSAIPTLRWSQKIEPNSTGGARLTVTVKRSGVRDDFIVLAPVQVEFDGNRTGTFFIPIRKNEETVTQELPAVPRKVVFAPDHSLLANIKRE